MSDTLTEKLYGTLKNIIKFTEEQHTSPSGNIDSELLDYPDYQGAKAVLAEYDAAQNTQTTQDVHGLFTEFRRRALRNDDTVVLIAINPDGNSMVIQPNDHQKNSDALLLLMKQFLDDASNATGDPDLAQQHFIKVADRATSQWLEQNV